MERHWVMIEGPLDAQRLASAVWKAIEDCIVFFDEIVLRGSCGVDEPGMRKVDEGVPLVSGLG